MEVDRHNDLVSRLADSICGLTTSEEWLRYLECQSRFRSYSFSNVLLISSQRPDASRVAGLRAWNRMGRVVRKGEKAIWILAPIVYRRDVESHDDDQVIRGFKPVAVFDVSQTEGTDLPEICRPLTGGEPSGLFDALVSVAGSIGFEVENSRLPGGVHGDCSHRLRMIRIESANSPAQRVKTLVHELAHALLHVQCDDRRQAELEAESTAYVVCQNLGIDTSGYSLGYVATWAGGCDEAVSSIKSSCRRIQTAASAILDGLGTGADDAA